MAFGIYAVFCISDYGTHGMGSRKHSYDVWVFLQIDCECSPNGQFAGCIDIFLLRFFFFLLCHSNLSADITYNWIRKLYTKLHSTFVLPAWIAVYIYCTIRANASQDEPSLFAIVLFWQYWTPIIVLNKWKKKKLKILCIWYLCWTYIVQCKWTKNKKTITRNKSYVNRWNYLLHQLHVCVRLWSCGVVHVAVM